MKTDATWIWKSEKKIVMSFIMVGQDSAVGIATRYGLDGPGIETWWRATFPHLSIPALGPTQPPV